jgi:ketol-acid reductoisomerase
MVAPKGPGYQLRQVFLAGKGLPCLIACSEAHGPETLALALSYAKALGCTRQGALLTSFREETETDLFGEQAVLCGGVPSLLKAAFSTLVEAGYSQELAYIECVYELKLIVDLLEKGGLSFLRQAISNTAEFGSYGAGDLLVDAGLREKMQGILHAIQSGAFAAAWMEEYRRGSPELMRQREEEQKLPIERCGASLRRDLLHG